ncbi:hypothetical protein HQN64_18975 [Enterobacteriaceae bacterium BIT-l23]|uniref:hypothetical protein n=1 Tax=Jejubacter sp. L23 TaxID=3092086 RepID=UPI0015855AAB|nr:hypothetical protein [Enterobacteriaceae bacterium BIT-l23]
MSEIEKLKEEHMQALTAYEATVQNLNAKVEALAAESARLKSEIANITFMEDEVFFNCDRRAQEVMGRIVNVKTPATDAVIADMRDTARNELYQEFVKRARLAGMSDSDIVSVFEATDALLHCAEQLRSGKGAA